MNTTKLLVKLFLVMSIFCATAFAEGSMSAGGFADDGNMSGGGFADDGNMGSGGLIENQTEEDSILKYVREYLFSIFG